MGDIVTGRSIHAAEIPAMLANLPPAEKFARAQSLIVEMGGAFNAAALESLLGALQASAGQNNSDFVFHWASLLPASTAGYYVKARWLSASGKLEESARQWGEFFSSAPCRDPFIFLQAARVFAQSGQYNESARLLREALFLRPSYAFHARAEKLIRQVWQRNPPASRHCRIAILGSSTTSLLVPVMRALCFRDGINAEFYEGLYGAFRQEVLNPESGLRDFRPDFVFIASQWRDLNLPPVSEHPEAKIQEVIHEFKSLWQILGERFGCHVVQHAFDQPAFDPYAYLSGSLAGGRNRIIHQLNEKLLLEAPDFVSILDTGSIAAETGIHQWDDPLLWHTAKQYPSTEALPHLAELQLAHVRAATGLTRKVLVCDLDNTLWGGVIGEDGLQGIRIGPSSPEGEAYADLQRYMLDLKSRGVLLAVCSKNNPEDAQLPFLRHEHMGLRLEDFAAFVANWEDKASNLRAIAGKLSLGTDSFVFLDDNPLERAWVRSQMPEVAVVGLSASPHHYVRDLDRGRHFFSLTLSTEDRKRSEAYRNQAERESLRETAKTLDEFLEQLHMRASTAPVSPQNLARVTQLINKTNQFNLTTKRSTEGQVRHFAEEKSHWTGVFQLADRFGDHGIIGVIFCLPATDPGAWEIDTWLMSCRVLGRQMEDFMLDRVAEAAQAAGIRRLIGIYRPTAKNVMVAGLYSKLGFEEFSSKPEEKLYELALSGGYSARCSFIGNVAPDASNQP
ncbi:MAG: HAD-IIIC family phosphatase [Terriglobia bacterium]